MHVVINHGKAEELGKTMHCLVDYGKVVLNCLCCDSLENVLILLTKWSNYINQNDQTFYQTKRLIAVKPSKYVVINIQLIFCQDKKPIRVLDLRLAEEASKNNTCGKPNAFR